MMFIGTTDKGELPYEVTGMLVDIFELNPLCLSFVVQVVLLISECTFIILP